MRIYPTISIAVSLLTVLAVVSSIRREPRVTPVSHAQPGGVTSSISHKLLFSKNRKHLPELHRNHANAADAQENVQETSETAVLMEFNGWVDQYLGARSVEAKRALETQGEILALERRPVLARLIESDPEEAIRSAMPMSIRSRLPASILQHLEERVTGRAKYEVIAAGLPGETEPGPTIERFATINGRTFRAFVYGRRLNQTTKENIPLYGIAIGDSLAVHQSPVRVLEPGESPDPSLLAGSSGDHCPVSQQAAASKIAVESGGEIFYICQESHVAALNAKLERQEAALGPATTSDTGSTVDTSWTHGVKKVLLMRVNFADALGESISEADAQEMMRQANSFFIENSYGAVSLEATVTPLLTMQESASWYSANKALNELLGDARRSAAAAGYNTDNYDLDIVHFAVSGLREQGYVGSKGTWLKGSKVERACHELGHNFGLKHANAWVTSDGSIIGPGVDREYGNLFDTMGNGQGSFNAYYKQELGWLPQTTIQTVTSNGVYRLYPFDGSTLNTEASYALRIETGTGRDYWIELRQQFSTSSWPLAGVLVYWSPWGLSEEGNQLLDMNPGGEGGFYDAQLMLGKSFVDPTLGLKITPLRLNGTTPESIDVMVTARVVSTSNVLDPASHLFTSRVLLEAQGDEAALAFNLSFPPAWLRNPRATLGTGAEGATLELDTDSTAFGRLGIRLSLPPGATFAAGVLNLLAVDFDAIPEIKDPSFIRVALEDDPASRTISDVKGTSLQAIYPSPALAVLASPPRLSVTREPNGDWMITLSNIFESRYEIQATSDFVTWDSVGTIPLMTGTAQITDSSAREQPYRFYRAIQPYRYYISAQK